MGRPMATTYSNPWHRSGKPEYGPQFFETDSRPTPYRGYLIFHRLRDCWDIVKDGECVSQCAGPNGARARIDQIIGEQGEAA